MFRASRRMTTGESAGAGEVVEATTHEIQHALCLVGAFAVVAIGDVPLTTVRAVELVAWLERAIHARSVTVARDSAGRARVRDAWGVTTAHEWTGDPTPTARAYIKRRSASVSVARRRRHHLRRRRRP
jgi:hypothetical protein